VSLAAVATVVLSGAVTATALPMPLPGYFAAGGPTDLTFVIGRGACAAPSDSPGQPYSRRGPKAFGYCFTSESSPKVTERCGDITVTGNRAFLGPFTGLRLSQSDSLRARYYWGSRSADGYTELDLQVHGSIATGTVRNVYDMGSAYPAGCGIAIVSFTARQR
jgi:hypothetical protein